MRRWVLGIALTFLLIAPFVAADNVSQDAVDEGYHDPLYVNSMVPYLNSSAPGDTEEILTWNGSTLELDNAEVAFEVQPNGTLDVLTTSGDIELQPSGNVSVGVDDPDKAFVVNGSGNFTKNIYKNDSEVATEKFVTNRTVLANESLNVSGPPGTIQFTNGTNLDGDGNFTYNKTTGEFGLGTQFPSETLTVNGSSQFNDSVRVDPAAAPSSIGNATVPSSIYYPSVEYDGQYAYVGHGQQFSVVDISDEENPRVLDTTSITDYSTIIDVAGDLAYVPHFGGGMDIIDVSNPTDLKTLGTVNTADTSKDVEVIGDKALLLSRDYGGDPDNIVVVDVSDPRNPTKGPAWDIYDTTTSFEVHGETAYVSDGGSDRRLYALNISDLSNIKQYHNVTTGNWVEHMELRGGYAYLTGYDKSNNGQLDVVNITDPSDMNVVASKHLSGYADGFDIGGDYAYFADSGTIDIWDVSDPTNPVKYTEVSAGGDTRSLDLVGQRALVGINDSLQVFDIGGARVSTLSTGALQSDDIYARGDVQVANELEVASNIEVGSQGINSRGPATFQDSFRVQGDGTVTGDLGVGTENPSAPIDVDGQSVLRGDVNVTQGNAVITDEVQARNASGLELVDDSGTGVIVDDGGELGIGTSSPGQGLTVANNDVNFNDKLFYVNPDDENGFVGIGLDSEQPSRDWTTGDNEFQVYAGVRNDELTWPQALRVDNNGSTQPGVGLKFVTSPDTNDRWAGIAGQAEGNWGSNTALRFFTDTTESARLDSNGRFGIGLTNPSDTLDVNGTSLLRDNVYVRAGDSSNAATLRIRNPSGNGDARLVFDEDNAGPGDGAFTIKYNSSQDSSVNRLDFIEGTDDDIRFSIDRSGDGVGIGELPGDAKLIVNGTGRFRGDVNATSGNDVCIEGEICLSNATTQESDASVAGEDGAIQYNNGSGLDGNVSLLKLNESQGQVGIGTTSPSSMLTIGETGRIEFMNSTVIGSGASGSGDSKDVAIGQDANVTDSGYENHGAVAIGLRAEAKGSRYDHPNVAVGEDAGATSEDGTAVGAGATAGTESTAVGAGANAPSRDIAIGYNANANDGIAIGNGVTSNANSVTIGGSHDDDYSVAVGEGSFASGSATAVGEGSNASTWGVAIGESANAAHTDGIAIGRQADAGSHGIAIGRSSSSGGAGIALGQSSSASGNEFIVGSSSDNINEARIGVQSSGAPLLYADNATGVGINTTSPNRELSVDGNANVTGNVSVGGSIEDGDGDPRIELKDNKVVINLG